MFIFWHIGILASTRLATQRPWSAKICKDQGNKQNLWRKTFKDVGQLGPLDFITSSTTIEDSAALLSHSKKASGSGLSVFHDFLARCITLTKQNNVCKIEKSFESNLNLSAGKWQCQLLHHYVVWVEYPMNVVHILVKHKMRILQLKVKLNLAWDYN